MLIFQFSKESTNQKIKGYLTSHKAKTDIFSEIYFDENDKSWHSLGALETTKRGELKTKKIKIYTLSKDDYLLFLHQFKPETSPDAEFATLFKEAEKEAYVQLKKDVSNSMKTKNIEAKGKYDNASKNYGNLLRKPLDFDTREIKIKQSYFETTIAKNEWLLTETNGKIALLETDIFISEQQQKLNSSEMNYDQKREQNRVKDTLKKHLDDLQSGQNRAKVILRNFSNELTQYIQWLNKTIGELKKKNDFTEILSLQEELNAAKQKLCIVEAQINVATAELDKASVSGISAAQSTASVFLGTGIHAAWQSEASDNMVALAMTRPDVFSILAGFATNVMMGAFFSYIASKVYESLAIKKIESKEKRPATEEEKKLVKRDAKNFGYTMFAGITGYSLGAAVVKGIFLACSLHPIGLLFTLSLAAAAGLASAAGACLTFWRTEKKKFLDENGKLKEQEWNEHKKNIGLTKKIIIMGISSFVSGFTATLIGAYVPNAFHSSISTAAKLVVNTIATACLTAVNAFTFFYISLFARKTKPKIENQNISTSSSSETSRPKSQKSSGITLAKILSDLFGKSKKNTTQQSNAVTNERVKK